MPARAARVVRDDVGSGGGGFLEFGSPAVSVRSGYAVVDVPLAFEQGDAASQVTFNADRQVAGFFIRRAEP